MCNCIKSENITLPRKRYEELFEKEKQYDAIISMLSCILQKVELQKNEQPYR